MLHIGVDEAGYGPVLGPLVIGVAAFRLPGASAPGSVDLRARLRGIVVRRGRGRGAAARRLPVPVDDSKEVHRRFGLPGLARSVGLLASAMDTPPPADLEDLLRRFSDRGPEDYVGRPWYAGLAKAQVPRYPWPGPMEPRFRRRGVQAVDLRVLAVDAPDLNEGVRRAGNKARVLGVATAEALLGVLDRHPGEDAEVVLDRHGARLDYRGWIGDVFPFASVVDLPSAPGEACYRVELPGRRLHLRFATQADRLSVAVGWASNAAKLTRELFMARLNAFFQARAPGVERTAGYPVDGRRFLDDVQDVIEREGIATEDLVRCR